MDAVVTEEISPDMYGEIKVTRSGKPYYFRAVSANGRTLPEGTEVIVIYSEDSACFVESKERFFDVLFDESAEQQEPPAQENPDAIGRA